MVTSVRDEVINLGKALKPGQVLTNPVELLTYEVDAAIDRGKPDGVIFVHSVDDVVRVVRWAHEKGIPVVARGAGTGLSGGAVAEHGGIILEFSRLNRILEFDQAGRSVVVEPGLVNLSLDTYVKQVGLYYPPDPASGRTATIGGNVAENAGGPHCFKYGVTTNYLTGMEMVLVDGRLVNLGGRAIDYPEYDLIGLITGSEGTLSIITRVSARLLRNPPAVKTMMAAFDSVEDAGEAVSAMIAHGLVPATMEFMDQKMMRIIEDFAHAGLPVNAGAALIIEVDGFADSLSVQMDEIIDILKNHKAWDMRVAQSAEERDKIWYGRKSAAGAMARLSPSYYLLDGTVPRSKLAHTLRVVNEICDELELRVGYVFHAGDGNLHPFILIEDPSNTELLERVFIAGERIMEVCVRQGGAITGEHGVGIEKRRFMPLMYGLDEMGTMLDVKKVFDPQGLLNPGKIFPGETRSAWAQRKTVEEPVSPTRPVVPEYAPKTPDEVTEALLDLAAVGQPVRIRGGGTKSLFVPEWRSTISTRNLTGICDYALEDLYVTVHAGTRLADLQAELARDRMWVPLVSPWPASTVGGVVVSNFNAPLRMRYGSARDLMLAASVVLPNGRVLRLGRPVVKNVAGYDLSKLFVGSHGTLGVVTDLTLKLAPLPRARSSLVVPVHQLSQGLEWGRQLLQVCLTASALLLCRGCDDFTNAPFALVYSVEGFPEDLNTELAQVRGVLQSSGATGLLQIDAPTGSETWSNWIASGVPDPSHGKVNQALIRLGVAPKDLPDLIRKQAKLLDAVSYIADLSSGMLYIQVGEGWENTLSDLRESARSLGGYAILLAAPPSETHPADPWGYVPEALELMKGIKAAWDPQGLVNRGAFLV